MSEVKMEQWELGICRAVIFNFIVKISERSGSGEVILIIYFVKVLCLGEEIRLFFLLVNKLSLKDTISFYNLLLIISFKVYN